VIDDAVELTSCGRQCRGLREGDRRVLPNRPIPRFRGCGDLRRPVAFSSSRILAGSPAVARRYGFDVAMSWEAFNNEPAPATLRASAEGCRTGSCRTGGAAWRTTTLHAPPAWWSHAAIRWTQLAGTGPRRPDEASTLVAAQRARSPAAGVDCASPGDNGDGMISRTRPMGAMAGGASRRQHAVVERSDVRDAAADVPQPSPPARIRPRAR
jgi:hypothetical protein